jgi:hypothetical protein
LELLEQRAGQMPSKDLAVVIIIVIIIIITTV